MFDRELTKVSIPDEGFDPVGSWALSRQRVRSLRGCRSLTMLGFDPAGFRSHSPGCGGFDPGSSSDPDNRPRVKGGVLIPPNPGFRSLMSRVRTLEGGFDP